MLTLVSSWGGRVVVRSRWRRRGGKGDDAIDVVRIGSHEKGNVLLDLERGLDRVEECAGIWAMAWISEWRRVGILEPGALAEPERVGVWCRIRIWLGGGCRRDGWGWVRDRLDGWAGGQGHWLGRIDVKCGGQ